MVEGHACELRISTEEGKRDTFGRSGYGSTDLIGELSTQPYLSTFPLCSAELLQLLISEDKEKTNETLRQLDRLKQK